MEQDKQGRIHKKKSSFFRVLAQMNVLILIVSFTIVGLMFVLNFREQTKDIFLENAESKINQNKVLIEYISDTVVNLSRQVFRNQKFNRLITTEFTAEMPRYEARTEAVKIIEPQQQAFQYIESLVFVGEDGFSVGAPVNKFLDVKENEFLDETLMDMAWDRKSEYIWLPPSKHAVYSPDKPVISVLKAFQNFITLENSGVLIINLNPNLFNDAISDLRIGGSGFMLIADERGAVIAKPDLEEIGISDAMIGKVIETTLENAASHGNQNPYILRNFESDIDGEFYFISYSRLEKTQWYTIAIVESSALTAGATQLINLMIGVIIVAVSISVLLSLRFSHWLFKPILHLSDTLKAYKSGDYDLRIEETYQYEFEILRENFNSMATRITNDFNRINEYSTNLENSKAELNKLNLELEARVRERTKELIETNEYLEETLAQNEETQAELMMTKDHLENSLIELKSTQSKLIETEKNAALGQLLAGISHEINTPLGTALTTITYLHTMQDNIIKSYKENRMSKAEFDNFMKDAEEMTHLIISTLQKTIGILDRFKEISILQAEKDIALFLLKDRLDDIAFIYKERDPRINYIVDVDATLELAAPRGLIQEIFEILIENSIVHAFQESFEGKPVITISAKASGPDLIIIYSDNGLGLEEHQLNRLFEPFYTTKFGSGGSGLGLHLLYNIVSTALQGRIDIVDIENQSVSFKLHLPNLIHNQES